MIRIRATIIATISVLKILVNIGTRKLAFINGEYKDLIGTWLQKQEMYEPYTMLHQAITLVTIA